MCFRSFLFMKEALIIYQEKGNWQQESHIQNPYSAPTLVCNIKHGGKEKQYLSLWNTAFALFLFYTM